VEIGEWDESERSTLKASLMSKKQLFGLDFFKTEDNSILHKNGHKKPEKC
jgi:hypothetical protein